MKKYANAGFPKDINEYLFRYRTFINVSINTCVVCFMSAVKRSI